MQTNLPNTIEDLARFVLVGREKLIAVRAEIRVINKLQHYNKALKEELNKEVI